jgi:hypothetical protein
LDELNLLGELDELKHLCELSIGGNVDELEELNE